MARPPAVTADSAEPPPDAAPGAQFGTLGWAVFGVSALYVALSLILVRGLRLPSSEAVARTAKLGSLYDGFDTSLLAAGLDRPPLLTLLAMPGAIFPGLRADGLAAALSVAALGGLTVIAARNLAGWAGLSRLATVLYVAAFALNPLLLVSGAIGLPDGLYATLMLLAIGQFMRWLHNETVAPVIAAGVAMGLAYALRYNSLLIAVAVGASFWWVARNRGPEHERADRAQATVMAFAVPVAFVVGLWAVIVWFPHGDPFEYLRLASRLSAVGGDSADVVRRMADLRLDAPQVLLWIGRWTVMVAPLSVAAIVAVAAHGVLRWNRESLALALVLTSLLAPEAQALFTGSGQPHVSHLYVAIVPAFAVFAYRERRLWDGSTPGVYDRRRHRMQVAAAAALLVASLATVVVLPLSPIGDAPSREVLRRVWNREPAEYPQEEAVAMWINANAAAGDVLVDPERAARVMLASGRYDRFRTPADEGEEATLFDPFGLAGYILVRRPVAGAGKGVIESVRANLFEEGAPFVSLAFETADYRVYAVEGPALR